MTDAVEQTVLDVIRHVLAMADDAYLTQHPEWHELVDESQQALHGMHVNPTKCRQRNTTPNE